MIVDIDPASATPPYEQIRSQLATLIASGGLPQGTRLPTIRQLAGDLGLAPGTVARAYRELEGQQLVVSRVRHGTVVASAPQLSAATTRAELQVAAREFAARIHRLGVAAPDAVAAIRAELARLPAR